jgi:hypothetical protein
MESLTSIEVRLDHPAVFSSAYAGNGNSLDHIDQFIDAYLIGVVDRLVPKIHTESQIITSSENTVKAEQESKHISPAKQERLRLNKIWQVLTRYQSVTADDTKDWQSSSVAQARLHRLSIHQAWLQMSAHHNPSVAAE